MTRKLRLLHNLKTQLYDQVKNKLATEKEMKRLTLLTEQITKLTPKHEKVSK